ncbi:MAG: zinc ribbon domain-containing protein [Nitrospirota bacterium]
MPLYEYHCEGCGKDFEEQQSLNFNSADTECPHCMQKKAFRKISAVSMAIKGATRKPRSSDIKAEYGMKKADEVLRRIPPAFGKRGEAPDLE